MSRSKLWIILLPGLSSGHIEWWSHDDITNDHATSEACINSYNGYVLTKSGDNHLSKWYWLCIMVLEVGCWEVIGGAMWWLDITKEPIML